MIKTASRFFLTAITLVTFGFSAHAKKPTNDELTVGIVQEFENFNPMIANMVATTYMLAMVYRPLMILDSNSKWVPVLATKIPSVENGLVKFIGTGDTRKMTAVWEIRKEATWGDGVPVTCQDIEFAVKVGTNVNVAVASREAYELVEKIEVDPKSNNKKCTITYNKAVWDFDQKTPAPMPRHLEEKVLAEFGSKPQGYDQNSLYTKDPLNPGLYNGPYLVSEVKLGSHVAFSPNPKYWGKKPNIKKIIVKLIPNNVTLEANLRSGTIDMISTLGFTFDQAVAFEEKVKTEKLPYKVIFQPGVTYEHIDLNLGNEILKDIKVRQALMYGINRAEITKSMFNDKQRVALHNLAPLDPYFTDDPKKIKIYNYSKREATKLLDEAGWKVGANGIREKNGQKLSLQFMTTAGNRVRETVQTLIQSQLRSIGIDVVIKNEPARVFFGETTKKIKYGGMAMYAWVSAPGSSMKASLHSTMIPTEKNGYAGQNQMMWVNAKVDKLLEEVDKEFNSSKRKALVHQILQAYTEDIPVIPLYYRADLSVIPENMTNYKMTGHLYYETYEVENWNLK